MHVTDGGCHCGFVRFRAAHPIDLSTARRCSCSLCAMRGAIAVSVPIDSFEIVSGADALTLYQFNTRVAEHYFCGRCGIYTHHKRRSNPNEYGVNVACLDGVSPFDFEAVRVNDGVNHPKDAPQGEGLSGTLRFERD